MAITFTFTFIFFNTLALSVRDTIIFLRIKREWNIREKIINFRSTLPFPKREMFYNIAIKFIVIFHTAARIERK
jgi:hypothetical protein